MKDVRYRKYEWDTKERFHEVSFISSEGELHILCNGYYYVYKMNELTGEILDLILSGNNSKAVRQYITENFYQTCRILHTKCDLPMVEDEPEEHLAVKLVSVEDLKQMKTKMKFI